MRQISNFKETPKKVEITMAGWDGTGYDGEGKKMNVWTNEYIPGATFVCKWMPCYKEFCFLQVDFNDKHEKTGLPKVHFTNSFTADHLSK